MFGNDPTLIAFLAVLLVIGIAGEFLKPARRNTHQQKQSIRQRIPPNTTYYPTSEDQVSGFPYELQHNFLSPAELSFFHVLRGIVGDRALVCPKVNLGDVFWIKLEDKTLYRGYRNKIDRKHVDFLLCDPATMRPLFGIELDDRSHEREDRQERDAFVDSVFEAARVPLLHIPVQRGYVTSEIDAQITPYLARTATEAPPPASIPSTSSAPICPRCGGTLVVRTVKSGSNAGQKFWGCANYPNCRHMARYSEVTSTAR